MIQNKNRISIQVGLSGYSFQIEADGQVRTSGWTSSERIFTTPELQKRYDDVDVAVFTPKCTLVPEHFHCPESSRALLSEVVDVNEGDPVDYVPVPQHAAVLVFSNAIGETLSKVISETVLKTDGTKSRPLPELYYMLECLPMLQDYNRILASYMDGHLYLVIAQGRSLLLCNTYKAPDFTTAQYFIFLAMKKLQLNPEMSTICFRTPLETEQEMSLYRYFRNVEQL
ncbi:MAG: DUF3822 family protein [Bacteroidales bacterium]|nr:DUF3822 family protein [Bacteroidales bacterium]